MTDLTKRLRNYLDSLAPPMAKGLIAEAIAALEASSTAMSQTIAALDTANAHIASLEAALTVPKDALPPDGQPWAKVSPEVAFHLIERHGENWAHIGQLMDAWRAAVNAAELVAQPADAQGQRSQAEPTYRFALIRDRNYDGEGLSLWFWNGENYSGSDGDCLSRDPDGSLDGFTTEWLTDHQLEQRLNSPDAERFVAFVGTLISDGRGLQLTDEQRRIKEALSVRGELSLDIVRARIDAALAKQQEPSA
jgi:hypothetical protein